MSDKKEKLIINGNALYEIDLDCMERKYQREKCQKEKCHSTKTAKNMDKARPAENKKKPKNNQKGSRD